MESLAKEVIQALVQTALPQIKTSLTPWKTDLAVVTDREVDGAFLVEVDGAPLLLHLEYQNYLDATMPERMHEYASLLEVQYRQQMRATIPVIPLVIWAIAGKTPEPVYRQVRFGKVLCQRIYFEVHLAEMNWHAVDPLLLVLAPYLQGVHREDLETIAVRLYQAAPKGQEAILLGAFLALSERKFANFDEIQQAILQKVRQQMNEIMQAIAESSIGAALLDRGKAEGKAEGEARGEARGKAEGEVLGAAQERIKMLRTLWGLKFGGVTADVEAALASAAGETLEQVMTQMIDPTFTLAQARAQLGL